MQIQEKRSHSKRDDNMLDASQGLYTQQAKCQLRDNDS